jgi:phenylpropionate dioxygenase-like ring-hydroxylating dioxygenase large terminal subunit
MYKHGWYKLAFERDLNEELTPATIGSRRFVISRTEQGIRVFDADCPHRGAHLAYGGRLDGNAVICPFHRYRIGIGREATGDFQVQEYETLVISGLIFVRLSNSHDNGFAEFIYRLAETHTINPGFVMEIKSPAEIIIENGFDNTHFRPVHGVDAGKFVPQIDENGSLVVNSYFYHRTEQALATMPSGTMIETPVQVNAFSPFLSVAQLGGRMPMVFMTSVNPIGENLTRLRFSLALSKKVYGDPAPDRVVQSMLQGNRNGIQCDVIIWENLSHTSPRNHTAQDAAILEFEQFCEQFH